MNPGQQCTFTTHTDGFHEFNPAYDADYARLKREGKPYPTRCTYVEGAAEAAYNARLKDPRHPRRDHDIEVWICEGSLNVAAATTYANRCGITVNQILQDHSYWSEEDETGHTD